MKKNLKDPKYIGIPNICFSLTKPNDKREILFSKQRIDNGFDDSETWSLDVTICKFIIPRLERFLEITPFNYEDSFKEDVQKFLEALKLISDKNLDINDEKNNVKIKCGLEVFEKIFQRLWW